MESLFVSAVTQAEIRFGIELVADATRRADLTDWLTNRVRPMFEQRVLSVSEDVMLKWRLMVEDGRKVGHTAGHTAGHIAGHTFLQPDLIIAATAAHQGLTVVTRDVSDFQRARVAVVNPWARAIGQS